MKKIFIQEKFISRFIFNPGLALIGSVPNSPALIKLNKPVLNQRSNRKAGTWSAVNFKNVKAILILVEFWSLFSSWDEWNGVGGRHLGLIELIGCYLPILPGHPWLLHSLVELSRPSALQSSPPCDGGGLVHVLLRVCFPPPQVFEHLPYRPQSE